MECSSFSNYLFKCKVAIIILILYTMSSLRFSSLLRNLVVMEQASYFVSIVLQFLFQ